MKTSNLHKMVKGWFIGNFQPSIIQTPFIEAGITEHKKDEIWPEHLHTSSDEVNVLLDGCVKVNGQTFYKNEIFVIERDEAIKIEFLTDCRILVIRIPNFKGDKVVI